MNVFTFIEAEKAEQHNVVKACELLEVSRSAFYEWHKHVPSARQLADEELGERIQGIYEESRGTYGWPRVVQRVSAALLDEEMAEALGAESGGPALVVTRRLSNRKGRLLNVGIYTHPGDRYEITTLVSPGT